MDKRYLIQIVNKLNLNINILKTMFQGDSSRMKNDNSKIK